MLYGLASRQALLLGVGIGILFARLTLPSIVYSNPPTGITRS
jgi:hypothetical protein